jgi:hypothetical protein
LRTPFDWLDIRSSGIEKRLLLQAEQMSQLGREFYHIPYSTSSVSSFNEILISARIGSRKLGAKEHATAKNPLRIRSETSFQRP